MGKFLKIVHLTPVNLLNDPLASCNLINFNLLLSHLAHFNKSIVLPFLVFPTFGFLLSVFVLHFNQ